MEHSSWLVIASLRELGSEVRQRGPAAGLRAYPELAEAVTEPGGGQRPAWEAAPGDQSERAAKPSARASERLAKIDTSIPSRPTTC